MTNGLKNWLKASRPRTLMLSFSGIMTGGFLSLTCTSHSLLTVVLCVFTAVTLQILSNLANDYGDFIHGIDNDDRIGPQRQLQSGEIDKKAMKSGIIVTAFLALAFGAALIFTAHLKPAEFIFFGCLGFAAILAALLYTLGRHPYGYQGFGDLFCFLFFGIVSVAGTYYLSTHNIDYLILLPAAAHGFLSNTVLNVNNMRDFENDKRSGKNTLVVRIGLKKAFVYHITLIISAFVCLTVFTILKHNPIYCFAFWIVFPFLLKDFKAMAKIKDLQLLDPFLKRHAIATFVTFLIFGVTLIL